MSERASGNPRLLHLGCGQMAPPEWVNVDGSWNARLGRSKLARRTLRGVGLLPKDAAATTWPENIIVRDLRKPLPFGAGSFDGAYSSHTVEHLYRSEAVAMLKEVFRVLRPGGVCRTVVPDLRALVDLYTEQTSGVDGAGPPESDAVSDFRAAGEGMTAPEVAGDPARVLNRELRLRKERPWGGSLPVRLYRQMYDFRSHKQMYDARSLIRLMRECGFVDCRTRGLHESELPFIEKVEKPERVTEGGLAVEGRKPA